MCSFVTYFTLYNVFEVCPYYNMYYFFTPFFFLLNSIPLYGNDILFIHSSAGHLG